MANPLRLSQARGDFSNGSSNGDSVYLDYTGAAVPPKPLIHAHADLLQRSRWGNPHSSHLSSKETSDRVEAVRTDLLRRFNAGGEYDVIFAESASDGLQVLANSYPWGADTRLILSRSNHNSVNGLREPVRAAGGKVAFWETDEDLRLHPRLDRIIDRRRSRTEDILVAFPAQSNLSGVVHTPGHFVRMAKEKGAKVILDAAAYAPTKPIDLQEFGRPDAVSLSFYKIFGYPTGIGALMIRKDLLALLRHPSFAGGTVDVVHPRNGYVKAQGHLGYEYGTINYQGIPAVGLGFEYLDESLGGIMSVGNHVCTLTRDALARLLAVDGIRVYGPKDTEDRGGTIAFNVLDHKGRPVPGGQVVEEAGREFGLEMREGCHCNPGDASRALGLSLKEMSDALQGVKNGTHDPHDDIGVVRASFGYGTTGNHIDTLIAFAEAQRRKFHGRRRRPTKK